ncbi:MAG: hypothetical protein J7L66_05930 [Anaerolineaceae bacterium]|nr:hypothetical protein [Anaerolineaceae bacterium]
MMKKKRQLLMAAAILLLIVNIACEVTFSPSSSDKEQLSEAKILQTNQAKLETAVAQTVEALGPSTSNDSTQPDDTSEQNNSAPEAAITSTPLPCNKPKFISETIPDNSIFDPGDSFTKTWTVRNDGTCSWTTDYKLVFTSGNQMGGPAVKNFSSNVNPGESVTLSVDLTAPSGDGTYKGTWKIQSSDGEQFGNYWATIIVGAANGEPAEAFAVTSVSFGGDQMKVGFCPQSFNIEAYITANGTGKVKYHWLISGGYVGPVETVTFANEETKTVTLTKSLSCGGTCSFMVQLYVDSPNHQMFGTWPIALHCF